MNILHVIGWIAVAALAAFTVGLVVTFVKDYTAAKGGMWQKILVACRGSATWFTVKLLAIGSSILVVVTWGADLVGQPDVVAKLQAQVPPEYWGAASLVITILVAWSRLRTLNK